MQRVHRTNNVFDEFDNVVAVNIEDYSAAWIIRQLTEKFIFYKILPELQLFETKPCIEHPEDFMV